MYIYTCTSCIYTPPVIHTQRSNGTFYDMYNQFVEFNTPSRLAVGSAAYPIHDELARLFPAPPSLLCSPSLPPYLLVCSPLTPFSLVTRLMDTCDSGQDILVLHILVHILCPTHRDRARGGGGALAPTLPFATRDSPTAQIPQAPRTHAKTLENSPETSLQKVQKVQKVAVT